jgi:hypothetical protein
MTKRTVVTLVMVRGFSCAERGAVRAPIEPQD